MQLSNINPKDIIFALDIGTRSIIGSVGIVKDKKFQLLAEGYLEHEERAMIDGQIHDISLVALGVDKVKKQLESELGFKLKNVAIAAAGRFLRTTLAKAEFELDNTKEIDKEIVRSLELTAVKNAEEQINRNTEGKLYCVGYSVKNYYLNEYVISNLLSHKGELAGAEVIATFLPRSVVESLYAVMNKVDLNVVSLTLEPIAAMEAAIPKSLRLLNLALIDIGAGTSDIAISSKDSISAYGMVATAGDEVTEAIAQNYLLDFNTAERLKRECSIKDTVSYMDVLGFSNEVSSEEIKKVIRPVVNKICEDIASKVIELNGGKAPNAVFLVGGGAHTPELVELLAQKLNLPPQRIAIKGREAVSDCLCEDNSLGSTGVTVLGIALVAIMKMGHDFIDVTMNGSVISLFNSHKHTVADVMMQASMNPKILIARNGKNIRYSLNGVRKIAFGSLGTNAHITINGITANVDSEVREGDTIDIAFARDGKDASPKVFEVIQNYNSISFYLNDVINYIEPVVLKGENKIHLEDNIEDGDDLKIIFPDTIEKYKKYVIGIETDYSLNKGEHILGDDYVIKEGDRIYTVKSELTGISSSAESEIEEERHHLEASEIKALANEVIDRSTQFEVVVNDSKVYLNSKNKYIFIDIFDHIEFDLTRVKGNLVLLLNGKKAGYHDVLSSGDEIRIYWE